MRGHCYFCNASLQLSLPIWPMRFMVSCRRNSRLLRVRNLSIIHVKSGSVFDLYHLTWYVPSYNTHLGTPVSKSIGKISYIYLYIYKYLFIWVFSTFVLFSYAGYLLTCKYMYTSWNVCHQLIAGNLLITAHSLLLLLSLFSLSHTT